MKKLETKSCEEIMSTAYKPLAYCVDGLLTQGLYLLAGAPKVGKSWLALDICLSVAKGEDVLKHRTHIGTALYLCLEDSYNRIQNRLYELTDEPTEKLYFAIMAESLGNGLELQIEKFKSEHSDLKLVVIDTLQIVRNEKDCGYGADYKELSVLKSLADKLAITILLVHHTRKCYDSDPFNMISGSTGISGCVDGSMVLIESKRGSREAKLYCVGRDIENQEYRVLFHEHRWTPYDEIAPTPPDIFSFAIHDFMMEQQSFIDSATNLCDLLYQKFNRKYYPNRLSRDLIQHKEELERYGVLFSFRRSHGCRILNLNISPRVTVVTVEFYGWRSWILPAPEILRMSNLRCFSVVTSAKRVTVTPERVTVEWLRVTVTLSKRLQCLSAFCKRFVPSESLWGSLSGIGTERHTGERSWSGEPEPLTASRRSQLCLRIIPVDTWSACRHVESNYKSKVKECDAMRKRNVTITIRCTEDERQRIYNKARQHGLTLSDFVLRSALGKKIVTADGLGDVLKEQKSIGRNLNQIALLGNMGRLKSVRLDELIAQHEKATAALCEIAKAVR